MQYENVFKSDRNVHVILAFLKLLLLLEVSRGVWLLVLLRMLNVYSRSQRQNKVQHIHIHANKDKCKEIVQQYIKTANKTELELFYALQRSRGHKEHLKRS